MSARESAQIRRRIQRLGVGVNVPALLTALDQYLVATEPPASTTHGRCARCRCPVHLSRLPQHEGLCSGCWRAR